MESSNALGQGFLVGTVLVFLAIIIGILASGKLRNKKPLSTVVPMEVDQLRAHIEAWAAAERYEVKVNKKGELVIRTIRMNTILFTIIGIALVLFGIILVLLWFLVCNTYFVCAIDRYYTGSKVEIKTFGSGTEKTVQKLLATLPQNAPLEEPLEPTTLS